VAILDFNNSPNPITDGIQSWCLANLVVPVAVHLGVGEEYEYLRYGFDVP
jgi:ubiquinone/menaquinone biosynthesis C-methylase UbiE